MSMFLVVLGLSSSSSPSSVTSDNDDSRSHDSVMPLPEESTISDTKSTTKTVPIESSVVVVAAAAAAASSSVVVVDEEEGEIKDEDANETHTTSIEAEPIAIPVHVPAESVVSTLKKTNRKKLVKPTKKVGASKKRKIDSIKSELAQEQADVDTSSLVKRKKKSVVIVDLLEIAYSSCISFDL
jgi:hypothetical protein